MWRPRSWPTCCYTASETTQTGYAASAWGGDCAADGTITLLPGDDKTCTITNDDIAPKLTLVKQAIGLPDQSFCFTFTGPEDSGEFCIETTNGEGQLSEDVPAACIASRKSFKVSSIPWSA